MQLSVEKSSATIFILWGREVNLTLDIKINNCQVPIIAKPKILGVMHDPLLTFNTHDETVRKNVLKSLAGTNLGKDKETQHTNPSVDQWLIIRHRFEHPSCPPHTEIKCKVAKMPL